MLLDNVNSLDQFLLAYGDQLAAEARTALAPLHVASRDAVDLPPLLRAPFPAQGHVMMAGVKALARQKSVNFIAEMGTGKTLMAQGTVHADCLRRHLQAWCEFNGWPGEIERGEKPDRTLVIRAAHAKVIDVGPIKMRAIIAAGKSVKRTFLHGGKPWEVVDLPLDHDTEPGDGVVYDYVVSARLAGKTGAKLTAFRCTCKGAYRALVVCPTVLLEKWKRELINTVPFAVVHTIDDYRQLLALAQKWGKAREQISALPPFVRQVEPFRPVGYEWYLVGRDKMKLSCGWRHAFVNKTWHKGRPLGEGKDKGLPACPQCGEIVRKSKSKEDPVDDTYFGKKSARRKCVDCNGQMWQERAKPRRYAPARIIQKRLRRFFDVTVFDEAHEYKSDDSLQADAIGGIAAASKRCIGLTGTLVGGYAWHIRTLLFRLGIAHTLVEEGLGWNDKAAFNAKYGKLVTKETIHPGEAAAEDGHGRVYGRGSSKKPSKTIKPEPGIVPTIFRHLIGNSIFLSLNEVAGNLPPLNERVITSKMDPELRSAYKEVDSAIMAAIREMVRMGNKKALGMMLNVLLSYPDSPWNWKDVGYYDYDNDGNKQFHYVCKPKNLSPAGLREKEKDALEWVKTQVSRGHQCWLYGVYTDARDFQPRFVEAFRTEGLRVAVMRSGEVKPVDRERWIDTHGPKNDVILSHPALVQTGLDFFSKKTGHNYSSIGFFQTGYNLFTMRQASRRAWRIGQRRPCETAYFYYEDSMQSRAMALMGRKIQAAQALEGNFSAEGLAAMAGDDGSIEMELAKSLLDRVDDAGSSRAWERVTEGGVEAERTNVSPAEALADVMALMASLGMSPDLGAA